MFFSQDTPLMCSRHLSNLSTFTFTYHLVAAPSSVLVVRSVRRVNKLPN